MPTHSGDSLTALKLKVQLRHGTWACSQSAFALIASNNQIGFSLRAARNELSLSMIHSFRLLEVAGVASLIGAIIIAYMFVQVQAAKRKRQLASKFRQSLRASDKPSDAAIRSLAMLYGLPRRKK
jgi:hypothetical protein